MSVYQLDLSIIYLSITPGYGRGLFIINLGRITPKQFSMNALVVCYRVEIQIIDDSHCIGILKSQ